MVLDGSQQWQRTYQWLSARLQYCSPALSHQYANFECTKNPQESVSICVFKWKSAVLILELYWTLFIVQHIFPGTYYIRRLWGDYLLVPAFWMSKLYVGTIWWVGKCKEIANLVQCPMQMPIVLGKSILRQFIGMSGLFAKKYWTPREQHHLICNKIVV